MRWPIVVKFRMMINSRPNFIMPVQNFGGPPPKKFRAKNMQNLPRFWPTSNFDGECLWNGLWYSKSDKYLIYCDSSRFRQRQSGELSSSNHRDLKVKLYPLKAPCSENHIFAPRGCCALKFLHVLEKDQLLLVPLTMDWGPPYNFFQSWSKIGLKFDIRACSFWGIGFMPP